MAAGAGAKGEEMDVNRDRAVELAISQIEKQFGKGAIMKMGADAVTPDVATISTGSLALDIALGVGGLPRGRVVEIYGPESSGKTTLALQVVAEAQKEGGICAFVDAEHALDTGYARKLGVKLDDLLISQPDNGEQALEIAETLVRSGAIDVLVVDSVAALVPRAELEGDMGDPQMGLQARLMSQALRKLTATIARSRTIVVFINQIRMKIGVMFGNPRRRPAANALKFYASVRMDIRRIGAIKQGDEVDRQPHQGEGRQEQGRAAVPRGRVRHPLRQGHLARRRGRRSRRRRRHRREIGLLVRVRRRAHRPGARERQGLPARSPGRRREGRSGDSRQGRRARARRSTRGCCGGPRLRQELVRWPEATRRMRAARRTPAPRARRTARARMGRAGSSVSQGAGASPAAVAAASSASRGAAVRK
jgi:recombination protein RecA